MDVLLEAIDCKCNPGEGTEEGVGTAALPEQSENATTSDSEKQEGAEGQVPASNELKSPLCSLDDFSERREAAPNIKMEPKPLQSTGRRFITPTPDAAASLPTPLAQSPPAEKLGATSLTTLGLPTPLTPVASTSRLPATAPATPRSRSPTKAPRMPIPLTSLIPVGTILLRNCVAYIETSFAEDGWLSLAKGVLEQLQLPADEVEDTPTKRGVVAETEPVSPVKSKARSKTKAGTRKRKSSISSAASPAKKKAKFDAPPEALLEVLLHLQDALHLRITFIAADDAFVLRIYLVPSDAAELALEAYVGGRRASPADSMVLRALAAVRLDKGEWNGVVGGDEVPRLMDEKDQRSILELYRAVEAPPLDPFSVDSLDSVSDLVKDRIAAAIETGPASLVTEMYPYQKASLGKMLQRELAPQRTIDPCCILRNSIINDSTFFVSSRGEVAQEPPRVEEPKSGILAEEMGSGKTLISIALVLSTLGELPDLTGTPTYLDGSDLSPEPILMTHLSCNFPFKADMDEQRSLRPRVPPPLIDVSLMDSIEVEMYERALARQAAEDAREKVPDVPSLRDILISFVRTSPIAIPYSPTDPRLLGTGLAEQLADTNPYYTLRPSPYQLSSRSGRTGTSTSCNIIVTSATCIVVPTGLVKQWEDELKKHVKPGSMRVLVQRTKKDTFVTPQQLAGYDLILMSIARFSDAADDPNHSLRRVHLKRLMVDEGHALSSDNRMRRLAEEIRVECRWAISGTPSQNLRSQHGENEGALFAHDAEKGGNETDYSRLAELYSRFLRHPAVPKAETFRHLFTDSILKHGRGAERLARLFNNSIIRNPPERIKEAYTLPPLTSEVVYVELGETERKTYNALIAVYKINSVLTQRVDQDYLFASNNKKHLDELTANLSAASAFFAANEFPHRIRDAVHYADETLNSEKSLKWTEEDREALRTATVIMREALDDQEWRATFSSVNVNIEVQGLDSELVKLFGGLAKEDDSSLVPLHGLVTLRVDVKELQKPDVGLWKDDDDLREELITFEQKRQRLKAMPANSKARAELEEPKMVKKKRKKGEVPAPPLPLPPDSIFQRIQLGSTTSAKVNYIINDARQYPEEKIIVFCSSLPDLVFAQLSEALDLVGIRHAIFAGGGSAKGRDRGIIAARFNMTSAEECQVILVDARLGGRGFCLTAATRVIMMEPIWLPDLEVQAAKRAHRLGQTKPVSLAVLVVPGSYEDALLKRRAEIDPTDFSKNVKQPQRDSKLANVLQSASYLEPSTKPFVILNRVPLFKLDAHLSLDDDDDSFLLPLPPLPPLPLLPDLPSTACAPVQMQQEDECDGPPPKKIKKSVQFA